MITIYWMAVGPYSLCQVANVLNKIHKDQKTNRFSNKHSPTLSIHIEPHSL